MILSPEESRELARMGKLAVWLDSKYETPIGVRVGWDGIIGLVPVVGEFITTLISGYLIARAAMLGASTPVLLRMGLNVVIDDLISIFPLVGWIGDFFFKSNNMNVALLKRHLRDPATTRRRSVAVIASVVAVITMAVLTFALLTGVVAYFIGAFLYGIFVSGMH